MTAEQVKELNEDCPWNGDIALIVYPTIDGGYGIAPCDDSTLAILLDGPDTHVEPGQTIRITDGNIQLDATE